MHGLILLQLQKFAQQSVGADRWRAVLAGSGLESLTFSAGQVYDDKQVIELVGLASKSLDLPVDEMIESFGKHLSTELIKLYQRVIKPEWKTLDIIENTETFIHSAVRVGNPGAMPPPLDAIRTGPDQLQLLYSSERKLCRLAIGIIKGLAEHFHESIEIQHEACMLQGDPFCSFQITRVSSRRDTQDFSIGNTMEADRESFGEFSSQGSAVLSEGEGKDAKKANLWNYYLPAALVPSDIASIGPYRLVAKHGEGGMGAVFRAIDTRTDESVAIKVVHPKVAENENSRKRFIRETRAVQVIKSPHVVHVIEVGEVGGLPFMVMEFLRGMTVQSHRERFQSLPVHEIIRIALETAQGLAEVHRCGIIHRDIKPENLWVESPSLRIKIIDFGLARDIEEEMRLTRTGACLGTPSYMSPEQALGGRIDFRSDLFSLGCVLYELATGIRPFEREGLIGTLNALTNEEPLSPSKSVDGFPEGLSKLIMHLLEKDPDQRVSNCEILQQQLKNLLTTL
jgi:predicted hydrocarbon binding protein